MGIAPGRGLYLLILLACNIIIDTMGTRKKVLAISGSTRKNSTNDKLLGLLQEYSDSRIDITLYDHITRLPYFTPGMEPPASVLHFIRAISQADGVLICTPEYVFSLPGVLKNALEWTVSTVVFTDKPTAFIVASSLGEKAFESLDLVLKTLGATTGEGSKLLISGVQSKIDARGRWKDETAQRAAEHFMDSFVNSLGITPAQTI